jgi:uncharacterized protein involved in exopolysaccharide biosynthesis
MRETQQMGQPARALLLDTDPKVVTLREIAGLVFKHLPFAIAVFFFLVLLGTAIVYLTPQVYEAHSKVLIERGKSPTQRADIAGFQLEAFEVIMSEIEIVRSRTVAEDVVDSLGLASRPRRPSFVRRLSDGITDFLDTVGLLTKVGRREKAITTVQRALTVEPAPQSSVLVITYASESPTDAKDVAQSLTEAYLQHHRQVFGGDEIAGYFKERVQETDAQLMELRERLRRETDPLESGILLLEVGVLEKAYVELRDRLNSAEAERVTDASQVNIRVIDYPTVPEKPARPRLLFVVALVLAGVLLAIGLSLVREYFDQGIYTPSDLDKASKLPLLGSVRLLPGRLDDRLEALHGVDVDGLGAGDT